VVVAVTLAGCVASGTLGDDLGSWDTPTAGASTGGSAFGTGGNAATGGSGGTGASGGSGGSGAAVGSGGTGGTSARAGAGGTLGNGGRSAQGGAFGMAGSLGRGGVSGSGGVTPANGGRGGTPSNGRGGSSGSGRGGMTNAGGKAGAMGAAGRSMGSAGAVNSCASAQVPSGGSSHCSSNQSGTVGSQQWTIWSSGSGGCLITYGSNAAFSATWNNSGDFLARVGLAMGSNKTYDQFGTIGVDFAETKSGSGGGYSSIGVYGWSVSPIVEFYVVEDSYGRLGGSGTKKGTFTIDGEGTYDVYVHQQVNQPSIQGTTTFDQFISVRQAVRTCGHISLTKHFDAWKGMGMTLGKMEEAKVLVEAGGGSGRIDFTTALVTAQ